MGSTVADGAKNAVARFNAPRLRPDRVRRPRLLRILERAAACRLVFVRAPAGFGKTTVVADWLAVSRRPCAWIGIDRGVLDADGLLARMEESVDAALGADPASFIPGSRDSRLLALTSRIAESGLPLAIVLDDFHNLDNPDAYGLVARLCTLLPEGASIVAASREGIPFPVALLRSRGELAELGVDELRFTISETREFLYRVYGRGLSDEEISTLGSRTEGWIAGLQLATLALRDRSDPAAFIAAFRGTTRAVYDFLVEEALAALPRDDLDFMTAVSTAERFCAPLCAALSGDADAGGRLYRLEKDCLFIVPLDDERTWFRYHHLFREALLGRLRSADPGRERGLRLAASAWLDDNGLRVEALRQAVLAGDAERAGSLSENYALALLERGDIGELREAFRAFAPDDPSAGPWVMVAAGWTEAYAGELESALSRAATAEASSPEAAGLLKAARGARGERFRIDGAQMPCDRETLESVSRTAAGAAGAAAPAHRRLAGQIEAIRAYVAWLQAESSVAAERATRALELLPPSGLVARCHAETTLGYALYMQGLDAEAGEVFRLALETARKAGMRHIRYMAAAGLATVELARGELDRAKALCLSMIAEPGADHYPALGDVYVILSQLEWERDGIAAALEAGRQGLDLCLRWGQADGLVAAYIALANALSAAGEPESGIELLSRATRLESVSDWHKLNLEEAAASLELERGNRAAADGFCNRPQPVRTFEGVFTLAHWLIQKRRPAEAIPHIEFLLERAEQRGLRSRIVDAYILQALAAKARGERGDARGWISRAVGAAEPGELVRRFVRRGAGVAELLRERYPDVRPGFVETLLKAFDDDVARRGDRKIPMEAGNPEGRDSPRRTVPLESLTPREVEVVKLLGEGLTADEISARTFVATSTIRSHIKSIYAKLGAHRRVEALRRAGELGLL